MIQKRFIQGACSFSKKIACALLSLQFVLVAPTGAFEASNVKTGDASREALVKEKYTLRALAAVVSAELELPRETKAKLGEKLKRINLPLDTMVSADVYKTICGSKRCRVFAAGEYFSSGSPS